MQWKLFRHNYEKKMLFHVNEPSGKWLEEMLNNLHADTFIVLTNSTEAIEIAVRFPREYDQYDEAGNEI